MVEKIAITLTTINTPSLIEALSTLESSSEYDVTVVVVGDIKTPSGVDDLIKTTAKHSKFHYEYFDVTRQAKTFKKYKSLWRHLPFNSYSRRNFGDLYALENDNNYIIRIDDDNYPITNQFIVEHLNALKKTVGPVISSSSGWFNICETLNESRGFQFYPRGYPYKYRFIPNQPIVSQRKISVGVNAGLWIGDPDVDAITRLAIQPEVTEFNKDLYGTNFYLDRATWAPFDVQNTSYHADVAKIAFVSPFVGRYDDIYAGYMMRSVLDNNGIYVGYGAPIVKQVRNYHDLWNDEKLERFGNTTGASVIDYLKDFTYKSTGIVDNYSEMVFGLEKEFRKLEPIKLLVKGAKAWLDCIDKLK